MSDDGIMVHLTETELLMASEGLTERQRELEGYGLHEAAEKRSDVQRKLLFALDDALSDGE